jgi:hypothetical protein
MLVYFFLSLILFVLFTPGILITLSFSKNTKKEIIALTHGVLFSSVWMIICYFLKNHHATKNKEGLTTKIVDKNEEGLESSSKPSKDSATTQDSSITIGSGTIAKNTVSKMSNGDISIQNFNSNNIISLSGMINITLPSGIVDTICGLSKTST